MIFVGFRTTLRIRRGVAIPSCSAYPLRRTFSSQAFRTARPCPATTSSTIRYPNTTSTAQTRPLYLRQQQRRHLPSLYSSQTRAFSLWPKGNSPVPLIGNDGKLEHPSTSSQVAASSSTPVDFQPPSPSSTTPSATDSPISSQLVPPELAETIEETRQTLADFGLGKGWTSPIQNLLEWTHVTTGLPWYLTIAVVVIGVRLVILPVMGGVLGNNARLAHIQPRMMVNINKLKALKAEGGSNVEIQRLQMDTQRLLRDNNCNPAKSLVLPFVQMPLFIGFFVALRKMAEAGLPDFATGGAAWFTNLSAPDPYYVLPVLSSAATLAVLSVGEFGSPESTGPAKTIRNVIKLITPLIIWFTSYFPAAVLVYWVTHNTFSVLQAGMLRTSWFKKYFNIPDPPPRDPNKPVIGFKQAFNDTVEAFKGGEASPVSVAQARKMYENTHSAKDQKADFELRKKDARDALRAIAAVKVTNAPVANTSFSSVQSTPQGNTISLDTSPSSTSTSERERQSRVAAARRRRESQRTKKNRF